jgi:hypothetical protein
MRSGLEHFLKVTRSFWPGLFQCYDHPDLPRTDNDLEHVFGTYRHHERRVVVDHQDPREGDEVWRSAQSAEGAAGPDPLLA